MRGWRSTKSGHRNHPGHYKTETTESDTKKNGNGKHLSQRTPGDRSPCIDAERLNPGHGRQFRKFWHNDASTRLSPPGLKTLLGGLTRIFRAVTKRATTRGVLVLVTQRREYSASGLSCVYHSMALSPAAPGSGTRSPGLCPPMPPDSVPRTLSPAAPSLRKGCRSTKAKTHSKSTQLPSAGFPLSSRM